MAACATTAPRSHPIASNRKSRHCIGGVLDHFGRSRYGTRKLGLRAELFLLPVLTPDLFRLQPSEESYKIGGPPRTRRNKGWCNARLDQRGDDLGERHLQAEYRLEEDP